MFSENEKISGKQLYRSIVVTLAGPTLLVCPRVVGRFGGDGFYVYGVAGILTILYTGLMLCFRNVLYTRKSHGEEEINNPLCIVGKAMVYVLLFAKLLILAVGALYLICDVVTGILLPETHILIVIAVIAVALLYWNQGSIESSARAFEILFYWVLIPIIIAIGMAVPKIQLNNLEPDMTTGVKDIIMAGVFLWFLFTPAELLVLCGKHYRRDNKTTLGVWRGVFVLFGGNIITYVTILGIYGKTSINEGSPYPLLKVMQISGVPGDFLRRVDGFMSVFLVLSLFCGMVLLLDYMGISIWQIGNMIYGRREDDGSTDNSHNRKDKRKILGINKKILFSSIVIFTMVVSVILIRKNLPIKQPAMGMSEMYADKKIISSVELEERAFVMSIIIGEETVTFEIASESQDKWQEESTYVTLRTPTVEEAEKLYKTSGDKRLDFTHMKMIFIDEKINSQGVTIINIKYMYEQEKYAENVLVCPLKGDMTQMAADAIENGEALAVNIEKIMENSGHSADMELYHVYDEVLNSFH